MPLLYRTGLGITQRGSKLRSNGKGQKSVVEEESTLRGHHPLNGLTRQAGAVTRRACRRPPSNRSRPGYPAGR